MNKHYSFEERREILQPLDKDGYSSDEFDYYYKHRTKNPYWNSERDRKKRKRFVSVDREIK